MERPWKIIPGNGGITIHDDKTLETHQLTDNMKVFFDKLIGLKKFVKRQIDEHYPDDRADVIVEEVYERLDAIIKEKK